MIHFFVGNTRRQKRLFSKYVRLHGCIAIALTTLLCVTAHAQDRLKVVTTTGIIEDTVKSIAGDDIDLSSLMGEGVDPHLYKASPGDVRQLSTADLIFYNGLHLEGKMGDILGKLGSRKPVVAVSETIPKEKLRQPAQFLGNYDPHVWFDVSLWLFAAERIRVALAHNDPAHAHSYTDRFERYKAELLNLDSWVRSEMRSIPREKRVLVTAHDAFGYFGRAYDVEVLAIQGMSTESEASLQDINNLVALLVRRKIPAVFVESSVSQKAVRALLEGAHAQASPTRIGGELYSDALGKSGTPNGTYIGMVKHNVTTIKSALETQPSRDGDAP